MISSWLFVWEWINDPGLANQFLPSEFSRHFLGRGIIIRRISFLMGGKKVFKEMKSTKEKAEPGGEGIIESRMSHA